jgi:hypothetical protein
MPSPVLTIAPIHEGNAIAFRDAVVPQLLHRIRHRLSTALMYLARRFSARPQVPSLTSASGTEASH